MKVVLDIETDGLDATRIWCCICKDIDTGIVYRFTEDTKEECIQLLNKCDKIIGHNIIHFDMQVLNRLWEANLKQSQIIDTLVLARLADSSKLGGYSLKELGKTVGEYKTYYEDWSKLTPEMLEYCQQDVEVTLAVYKSLKKSLTDFSVEAIVTEHESQFILEEQYQTGFLLDVDKVIETINEINTEYFKIIEELKKSFPPRKVIKGEWRVKRNSDGIINKVSRRIMDEGIVDGSLEYVSLDLYNRVEWKEFNINSPSDIVERLEGFWNPFEFTPNGQAKVSDKNLSTLTEDAPEACKNIVRCKVLTSRATLLQSYLDACTEDNRVHGIVRSIGTITHRMAHNNPNTGNIPSRGLYGSVCREVFKVGEGRKLVGCDAAGIQLRALAHYTNDKDLIHQILNGDIHWYLAGVYGLREHDTEYDEHNPKLKKARNTAKTITYCILMGGGVARVGSIAGGDAKIGKKIFKGLEIRIPGWKKIKNKLEASAKRGYMMSIDGRKIPIKSAHFGMSVLLQSFEQAIMKRAMVQSYKIIKALGLDSNQVAIVHDEFQRDTVESQAIQVGEIMRQSIIEAGEYFKTNLPMDGEYKIGNNWLETH